MVRDFLTITQLNTHIDHLLSKDVILSDLWLKGEVSGFKHYRQSGHFYFILKDENSVVSCVMFRSRAQRIDFQPADGMEVLARGNISVYGPQGKYQLYVNELQPFGLGGWHQYLEQLRQKYEEAGYFRPERKRPIPAMINRLGIVTSQDGAALQDILKVVRQRHSRCHVILVHSAVQGSEASRELAEGIRLLNEYGAVDAIIVGRGGGSWEDLIPFSSELVVEAIYQSRIPVISAVGHEIDVSLSDLVADLRAATPTQAAVMAVADMHELELRIAKYQQRMRQIIVRKVAGYTETLERLMMKRVWSQPGVLMQDRRQQLTLTRTRLCNAMMTLMNDRENRFRLAVAALDGVSPLKAMQRGYALVRRGDAIITRGEQVAMGDHLEINLQDANLEVEILKKEEVARWKI